MHEGDPPTASAGAWRLVDEAVAGFAASGERRVEVGYTVADMMDARPAAV